MIHYAFQSKDLYLSLNLPFSLLKTFKLSKKKKLKASNLLFQMFCLTTL